MTTETAQIIVSSIGAAAIILVGAMTIYGTILQKRIEKNQKVGEVLINGRMDELVKKSEHLGFEKGKTQGRVDALKEMSDEIPYVFFLDDDKDDIHLIVKNIKLFAPIKYYTYWDEDYFISNLSVIQAVYVIDNALIKRTGIDMAVLIKAKNSKNIIILSTGDITKEQLAEYHHFGINRIVYKDDKNYLITLDKYIKEGLQTLLTKN